MWIKPQRLIKTQCSFDSVLDFVFIAGEAKNWRAASEIMAAHDTYGWMTKCTAIIAQCWQCFSSPAIASPVPGSSCSSASSESRRTPCPQDVGRADAAMREKKHLSLSEERKHASLRRRFVFGLAALAPTIVATGQGRVGVPPPSLPPRREDTTHGRMLSSYVLVLLG